MKTWIGSAVALLLFALAQTANAQKSIFSLAHESFDKVNDEFDIKGFRIGMSSKDALKLVKPHMLAGNQFGDGCRFAKAIESNLLRGDHIIQCNNSITLLEEPLEIFLAFFIGDRLVSIQLGPIGGNGVADYRDGDSKRKGELPTVWQAFSKKYGALPKFVGKETTNSDFISLFRAALTDRNNSILDLQGGINEGSSSTHDIFSDMVLSLESSTYDLMKKSRRIAAETEAEKTAKNRKQKKAADL